MTRAVKMVALVGLPNPFLEQPTAHPRLGLLYLATVLREAGHDVRLVTLDSLAEAEGLASAQLDFIGVSATTREYPDAVQLLNYLKRERHRAVVAIGGPHATALPEEAALNGFDLVVRGEAEEVAAELVEATWPPRVVTAPWPRDLDRIPFPDRWLLEDDRWQPSLALPGAEAVRVATILLTRGCPYRCAFCGPHGPYRRRSDDNVARELALLRSQGYGGLVIADDLPFLDEAQVRRFCARIAPLDLAFRCNFRADLLSEPIVELLKRAGCCRLQIGVESAETRVLDTAGKGISPARSGAAVDMCRRYELPVKAMFIWGLPGDGPETADALVGWVARHRPESIQVSRFTPLPGSQLWSDGYGRRIADYAALAFFRSPRSATAGVGNDRLPAAELEALYGQILERCAALAHIDRGLASGQPEREYAAHAN